MGYVRELINLRYQLTMEENLFLARKQIDTRSMSFGEILFHIYPFYENGNGKTWSVTRNNGQKYTIRMNRLMNTIEWVEHEFVRE